jgi:4-phytase/acid phosphatase
VPQPLATASTFSENLLLEYTDGMQNSDLGWGRLTKQNLFQVLELHTPYADLMRRTPYLARVRSSNLLAHIWSSLEQAAFVKPVPGALGHPGDALLVLTGHDTNLSHLSGMLDLSWNVPGYQSDDAPPASALIFTLWQDGESARRSVKIEFVAASPEQMRNLEPLTLAAPPLRQELSVPGCDHERNCSWDLMESVVRTAIDPQFTDLPAPSNAPLMH